MKTQPQIALFQSAFFLILENVISLDFFEKLHIHTQNSGVNVGDKKGISVMHMHIRCVPFDQTTDTWQT